MLTNDDIEILRNALKEEITETVLETETVTEKENNIIDLASYKADKKKQDIENMNITETFERINKNLKRLYESIKIYSKREGIPLTMDLIQKFENKD